MSWAAAVAAVAEAFNKVFGWKTGGRSKDENVIRDEAQHWREEYTKAMQGGDAIHASFALEQLRRVRDKARAARES